MENLGHRVCNFQAALRLVIRLQLRHIVLYTLGMRHPSLRFNRQLGVRIDIYGDG